MRQLKAEYYKMKYSRASKWVLVFMAFIFFIPFVVGNDTLFMTFGDYRNIDSIGWICYIDDMNNVKAAEIARFALSINFFSWIGLIVYITTMVSAEFHQGTIRASVVYGINRTKLFLSKLLVINVHFFMYNICGYRMTNGIVVGTIMYGMGACLVGIVLMHFALKRQEL